MSMCEWLSDALNCNVTGVDICYNENPKMNIKRAIVACFTNREILPEEVNFDGMVFKSSKPYESVGAFRTVFVIELPSASAYYLFNDLTEYSKP